MLSEGQNLQDAGVLVNYDLHWNPVRMIQRAGRIDRLGTDYDTLSVYNCFPEEGLENLLGLVKRLQQRIATIDREVGLDASVLGETISDKSLEELYRLKKADTKAEKEAILEELEQAADLVSLDEMRLPLLEFIQQKTAEAVEEIPLGIHSTRYFNIPEPYINDGGLFLAFSARDRHFWHFYPRVNGHITTEPDKLITDKRKIFNWLKCKELDFPPPEELQPVKFDNAIFRVLETATDHLMTYFQKQQTSNKLKPQLTKLLQKIYQALTQSDLFEEKTEDKETEEKILKVITTNTLRGFEKDIKSIWSKFIESKDKNLLISELDEFFSNNKLYNEIEVEGCSRLESISNRLVEAENKHDILELIKREDIQLVCYQWFKPK